MVPVLLFSLIGLAYGNNNLQSHRQTKVDLLKSLIYDNTKATVTLDSSSLKQLIQLSSDSSRFPRRVSFFATVKSSQLTLGRRQTVKYDAVLTNEGNGYDDRTGVFTCPVAGTYMFVVDALSKPGTWLILKVNKETVAKVLVFPVVNEKLFIQISRTIIVKLKAGDHVKVVNEGEGGIIHHHLYSGFSGVFLH